MKFSLLLLAFFVHTIALAQNTGKAMNRWDSLHLRTTEEIKRFEAIVREKAVYIDTLRKEGAVLITFTDVNRMKLKVIAQLFNSENCLVAIHSEYYNLKGLPAFCNEFKKCCPEEMTDEYKCFERTTFYERFEYDEMNRLSLHVFHVTTPGTYKERFIYGFDGVVRIERVKIEETRFWE
jgi:hypothetical protein